MYMGRSRRRGWRLHETSAADSLRVLAIRPESDSRVWDASMMIAARGRLQLEELPFRSTEFGGAWIVHDPMC
jgi:hypothetical protein